MNRLLFILLSVAIMAQSCKTSKTSKDISDDYGYMLDTVEVSGMPKPYRASATREFDLLHTKIEVSFDWEKQHAFGKAYLLLKPYFYESNLLTLDAKGFDIHQVAMMSKDGKLTDLQFEYIDSLEMKISLPKTYTRKDTFELFIDYTAKPNERGSEGSRAIQSAKGLYFINPDKKDPKKPQQIWTQGETESNSAWFPTIDKPNERCTGEVCITVTQNFVTLSNGLLTEESIHADGKKTECWTMDQPHAPYLFMMAIGEYAVVKDKWRNMAVDYYVEPEYEPYAKNIFGNTPEMLEFFSKKLGVDYPWQKYAQVVVRDFVSGAMENTTASLFLEAVQMTDRELLDRNWDFIIAHELFHQWFGDYVTCESWSNITLNEAFATYSEYLWNEHKYGKDEADYFSMLSLRNYLNESRIYQEPLIRFHYDNKEDVFDSHSYAKGGLILHMLRKHVGDEAFFKSLQKYLTANAYKAVEAHHLRLAFEEVTGEDLNWFFNQWFFSAGHPKLTFKQEYSDSLKNLTITTTQKHSKGEGLLYRLPLQIAIFNDAGIQYENVWITDKEHTFEFQLKEKPKAVSCDVEKILVCEKNDSKETDEWKHILFNSPSVIDRHEALVAISRKQEGDDDVKAAVTLAALDKHWAIRELAIKKLYLDDSLWRAKHFELLKTTVLKDAKSQVRAAVVSRLKDYPAEEAKIIYAQAINDSSFMVVGASLKALYQADSLAALNAAGEFEKYKSNDMVNAVGYVYANAGDDKHYHYFKKKAEECSGVGMYYLVNHFSDFLLKSNFDNAKNGSRILKTIALEESSWWIRTEAGAGIFDLLKDYQKKAEAAESDKEALTNFVEQLQKDFEEIKEKETEKRGKEKYEMMKG